MGVNKDLLISTAVYLAIVLVVWFTMGWETARWPLMVLPVFIAARLIVLGRRSRD
ncbi:hypothetical protein ACQPZG_03925 (plasmid) [Streptomyces sp. CA-294286]|uniref:hypothetical protein n=1 Tax=Streptomyces sp. CA-294286 TaxID=3240070 RepID=UPI003D9435B8